MQNKKNILIGLYVVIVILAVGIVYVLFSDKDSTSNLKESENIEMNEEEECVEKRGFWQENCVPDDSNFWCCAEEDKNAENTSLVDKKDGEKISNYEFFKIGNEIFAGNFKIKNVDLETFVILGNTSFSKDKNNAYVDGDIIEGADLNTFVVGKSKYNYSQLAMDKNNLYLYDWEKGDFSVKPKNEKGNIFNDKYYKSLIKNTIYSKEEINTYFKNLKEGENNNLNNQKNMEEVNKNIDMNLAETCESAKIITNYGEIDIKFYNNKAPVTVANFCTLAKKDFYNGVRFHRVISDFMIQAGDPNSKDLAKKNVWGTGGPGYQFKDELPRTGEYKLGSIAMANAGANTNGSQFFIVSGEAGVQLPPMYSLFGEVTKGMEIVDKIQNVETEVNDRPVKDVIIESVKIVEK